MNDIARRVELLEAEVWAQLHLALPSDIASHLGARVRRVGAAACLATPGIDISAVNRATGLGFDEALTESRLASIRKWFAESGVKRWMLEWSPAARPLDGAQLLERSGGSEVTPGLKLYRELRTDPRSNAPAHPFTIREIDEDDAARYAAMVAEPLGMSMMPATTRATVGHPGWHFYLAFDSDLPIAGGALFVRDGGAWIGLAGTAPHARRRGAQTALLNWRLLQAYQLGCRWATAETRPVTTERPNPSLANMRRAGFDVLYERARFVFDAGAE